METETKENTQPSTDVDTVYGFIRSNMLYDKLIDGREVFMLPDGDRAKECADEIVKYVVNPLRNPDATKTFDKSSIEHTPGPWSFGLKVLTKGIKKIVSYTKAGYYEIKAGVGYYNLGNPEENAGFSITGYMSEADAKLIHAAPELLEALNELWMHVKIINDDASSGNYHPESVFGKVHQAIKKATSLTK